MIDESVSIKISERSDASNPTSDLAINGESPRGQRPFGLGSSRTGVLPDGVQGAKQSWAKCRSGMRRG